MLDQPDPSHSEYEWCKPLISGWTCGTKMQIGKIGREN